MKRSGPIKRHARLKARRSRPRRSGRHRDVGYMLDVKQLACLMEGPDCSGAIEAHHAGERAAGRKADDDTCIPLCSGHHRAWHNAAPPFNWSKETRRLWARAAIAQIQGKLLRDATDFISELTW